MKVTAYILYWVFKSYVGSSAQVEVGALKVESAEACETGAAAIREMLTEGPHGERFGNFVYRCEKAK